jgi:hypothetical protein
MSLKQSIRTFQVTNATVKESFAPLIAKKKNEAQDAFEKGFKYIWRNETSINKFAHKTLATIVIDFEDGVNGVIQKTSKIASLKEELLECEPLNEEFETRLK